MAEKPGRQCTQVIILADPARCGPSAGYELDRTVADHSDHSVQREGRTANLGQRAIERGG